MRLHWAFLGVLSLSSLPSLAAQIGDDPILETVLTPSAGTEDGVVNANLSSAAEQSLLWGTWRPNLYFGMRSRAPQSLMNGLMWFGVHDYHGYTNVRHSAQQSDGLHGYNWDYHDGRTFGEQTLLDPINNLRLLTSWYKPVETQESGKKGPRGWAVRVKGEKLDKSKPLRISTIFYTGLDSPLGFISLDDSIESNAASAEEGLQSPVVLTGSSPDQGHGSGRFRMRIVQASENAGVKRGRHWEDYEQRIGKTQFVGLESKSKGGVWKAKDLVLFSQSRTLQNMVETRGRENLPDPAFAFLLDNEVNSKADLFALQNVYDGPFEFDIYFEPEGRDDEKESGWDAETLTKALAASKASYDSSFSTLFPLAKDLNALHQSLARKLTSSLIGGIGYFHGSSIVDRSFSHSYDADDDDNGGGGWDDDEGSGFLDPEAEKERRGEPDPKLTPPMSLFTATPSRSFFPRGFYWDEGFHLAHIGAWDNDLSLDILKSWVDLIDENGWVAREQILGEEARSKVPAEFQTQYPTYANPPTLTMAVTAFINRFKRRGNGNASTAAAQRRLSDADLGLDPMAAVGGGAVAEQLSFTSSANGTSASEGAGGDENRSGSSPSPSQLADLHLTSTERATSFLRSIYPSLRRHYLWFRRTQRGEIKQWDRSATSRHEAYRWRGRTPEHVLTSGLDDYPRAPRPHSGELHVDLMSWMGFFARTMSEIAGFLGEVEEAEEYERQYEAIVANLDDLHWNEKEQMYCDASVDELDESFHVCHRGYVSLFPLLLSLIEPTSPHLGPVLELMRDPEHLWSPFGLRSLSKSHELYGQGENYWKGPVWVQMNYLALAALKKKYAIEPGPYRERAAEIYAELRQNVIDNVFKEFQRTNYVWEQYDPETGEGRRSAPFTGWTSLVALIMAEIYD